MRNLLVFLAISLFIQSCSSTDNEITKVEKQEIIKSATEVIKRVFEYSNNMDFESGLNYYSDSSNAYFVTDGTMYSLAELKKIYKNIGPSVEILQNTIQSWNVDVLSRNVVTCALPVKLKLKFKGLPEYEGQLIWTATLQKHSDGWMIVQSHESWLNCAEVAAALNPTSDI